MMWFGNASRHAYAIVTVANKKLMAACMHGSLLCGSPGQNTAGWSAGRTGLGISDTSGLALFF